MSEALKRVVRNKVRFATPNGVLSAEDLWDLPLTSTTGRTNLNDIARGLDEQINSSTERSFVASLSNRIDPNAQAAFEVVIDVIKTREAEAEANRNAQAKAARKQELLEALKNRENADLAGKSSEELRAMIEQL